MLYIFDKDGTLVHPVFNRPANTPQEQILMPGVLAKIEQLRSQGALIAIASNQGGVAWGLITEGQARELIIDCAEKLGGVDAWRFCPFDPRAATKFPHGKFSRDDGTRKPHGGMLLSIMFQLSATPEVTVMVGDQESDHQAAQDAGCAFEWARDFFKVPHP